MKFIHSSDLQIGKAFGTFSSEVATLLQEARQTALRALGDASMAAGASTVLIAGDVFEREQMSQSTLLRALETMRAFDRLHWHLLPGNHDHYRENGLWDRLARALLPPNVHFHVKPGAVAIADDDGTPVYLLPAPLFFRASADDLTAYMAGAPTPERALRIGLAHGSIQGFGSEGDASNYIDPGRAESAGLSYLALGDWHRQMKVNDRCWYSGTPEPDRFKRPPDAADSLCNGGGALVVEITGSRMLPNVQPVPTGRYKWHQLEKTLTDDARSSRSNRRFARWIAIWVRSFWICAPAAVSRSKAAKRSKTESFKASAQPCGRFASTNPASCSIRPNRIWMTSTAPASSASPPIGSR